MTYYLHLQQDGMFLYKDNDDQAYGRGFIQTMSCIPSLFTIFTAHLFNIVLIYDGKTVKYERESKKLASNFYKMKHFLWLKMN